MWRGPRLTLPPSLRPRWSTPTAIILFDQDGDRVGGLESLGTLRQATEQGSHWTNVIKRTQPDREIFCLNLRGRHFTYSSTFRFDLRTLLALHAPPPPPWLHEALYGAYGLYREGIEYPDRGKQTGLVRSLWCNEAELFRADGLLGPAQEYFLRAPDKLRGEQTAPPALLHAIPPLASHGAGGLPGDARPPEQAARWAATCALFARWAMYAQEGKRHDAFWRFADAACSRVIDEAFFRECFGLGYEDARTELAWFLPIATGEQAVRSVSPLVPPKLKFRAATAAEVARVRGDWERGEAALLAHSFPEIAEKYSTKAGRTLRPAQAANPDDARLAEVTGLYEFDTGNHARALELLTAATAGGRARPRSWWTLAHLQFLRLDRDAATARAPISHRDALQILLPLEQAWQQAPAMAPTYELMAELGRRCPELPAAEMAARLQEGQKKFPRNTRLTFSALRACVERGEHRAALNILDAALPFTTDPAIRDRMEKTSEVLRRTGGAKQ